MSLTKSFLAAKRFSIKEEQTVDQQKLKLKELIFSWTFLFAEDPSIYSPPPPPPHTHT